MKKRILSILLVVCMIVPIIPTASALTPSYTPSAAYRNSKYYTALVNVSLTGDYSTDLVNVALSQVGYHEGNSTADLGGGNTSGSNNYTEYGYWYGYYGAWCAMFISWCARQAQIPTSVIKTTGWADAADFGVSYYSKSDYTPKAGDIIIFDWDGTWSGSAAASGDHVGIVYYVDGSNVYYVDGNGSDSASSNGYEVKKRVRALSSAYIKGYGVYTNVQSTSNTKDTTYSSFLPFKCKLISSGNVTAYLGVNGASSGSIYPGDDCTIQEIYTNGWCKVSVPWDNGTNQIRYVPTSVFINSTATPYVMTAPQKATTYYSTDKSSSPGYIDAGDTILVVASSGSMTQIIYYASANYRCAWVETEKLTTTTYTQNSNYSSVLPFKCKMISSGNIPVYGSVGGSSVLGYIYPNDDCIIQEIYTNGWAKIQVPWDNNTMQTCFVELTQFGPFAASPTVMTAPKYATTYYNTDMTSSPGYVDVGDTIYIVATSGNMSRIIYPATSNYRCAWVPTADLHVHTLSATSAKAATCETEGNIAYWYCTSCGKYFSDSSGTTEISYANTRIAALGHTYTVSVTAPTCISEGYTTHTCSRCGSSYVDTVVPALGHNWSDWSEQKAATETEAGEEIRTCQRCGISETRELPALGHTHALTHFSAVAASCTVGGNLEYWYCEKCGGYYLDSAATQDTAKDAVSLPPLGHNYVDGVCTRCGQADPDAPIIDDTAAKFVVSQAKGRAGQEVQVEISMENNPGIITAQLELSYDSSKLQLVNVEDAGLLKGDVTFGDNLDKVPFTMAWNDWSALEDNTGNGTIAILTFLIKEDCPVGDVPVSISYEVGNVFNFDMETVDFAIVNGAVSVIQYTPGDTNDDGVVNQMDYTYLRRYLAGWSNVSIVKEAADVNADGNVNQMDYTLLRRYLAGWENVTLHSWDAASVMAAGTGLLQGLPGSAAVQDAETDFTFVVSDASGKAGEEVEVTISIENNPGIITAAVNLSYDNTKLQLLSATDASLLKGDVTFGNNLNKIPYTMAWNDWSALENNTSNGVIVTLKFKILEDCEPGNTPVTISINDGDVFNFDLQVVDFVIQNGTLTIEEDASKLTHVEAKAATCTEPGNIEYWYDAAGNYYSDAEGQNQITAEEIVIPALGHDWSEWTVTKAAICTEDGEESRSCNRCGETETRPVEALGHDYKEIITAPTCTEKGYTTHICSRCGDSYVDSYVDALGHDWGEWTVTKAATCIEDGEESRSCNRCGETATRPVEALGHDYRDTVTAPTCTEKGYTTHTCSRCGDSYVDSYVDALGHDWGEWTVTKAATCTEDGEESRSCNRCGETETRPVEALGHDWSEWTVTKAATCTEDGEESRSCNRCGETATRPVEALGHDYKETITAPTCTEEGYTTHTCSRCGDSYVDSYVDALGHDWGEWTVTKAATCTEDGEESRSCNRCGDTETRPVEALGHDFRDTVTAPTCTEKGYTTHTCSRCGDSYVDSYVDALGHDWGEWTVTKTATCTEDGEESRSCNRCGETETRPVEALGHDYKETITAPTCTEKGYTTHTCSHCGDSYVDSYVDALGHDWSEWTVTKEATEEENGERSRTCSRCDEVETEVIPATGHTHTLTYVAAKNASCTEAGNVEYWYCAACGKYFADEAAEHEITLAETLIPAVGHTTELQNAKDATCTEDGYTGDLICTVCGETVETGISIPALGHNWDEWTVTTTPTCTEEGVETRTCKNDASHTETRPVDALGHGYDEVVTEPTCTEQGYTTYTCSRCGDSYVDDYVDALGHDYAAVVTEPTCTEEGYTTHTCSRCGDSYVDSFVEPHGHEYEYVNQKMPTFLEPGYSGDLVCKHCGDVKEYGHVIPATGTLIGGTTTPTKPTDPFPFTDVSTGDTFYDAVKYVYEEGLMNGVSDTRFAPQSTLTRAMVVTILYRIEGEPATRYNGMFPDVPNYQWYTDAVEWAAKNQIVTGYTSGKFGPEDPVTREQLAAILYRYAQSKGYDVSASADLGGYADGANVSSYAVSAVKWAVAKNILEAQSGNLRPRDAANRAQVAVAVAAFHKQYIK